MSRILMVLVGVSALLAVAMLLADPTPGGVNRPDAVSVEQSGLKLVTPPTQAAIDRGLQWLAGRQAQTALSDRA